MVTEYEDYLKLHALCGYSALPASRNEWLCWSVHHKAQIVGVVQRKLADIAAEEKKQAALHEAEKQRLAVLHESNYGATW